MGHAGNKLGYDKASKDKEWTRREYIHASKFLNIMSSDVPFGKVGQDIVEQQEVRIAELQARVKELEKEKLVNNQRYEERTTKLEKFTEKLGKQIKKLIANR